MAETIERQQFCGFHRCLFPQFDNAEYLEYERRSTGLSSGIIAYGYVALTPNEDGSQHYRWLKLSEVPESIRLESESQRREGAK